MERIDSCHSIWVVDTDAQQFCRLPRGSRVEPTVMRDRWESFTDFEVHEDGAHVLALNEDRTRLLRFWAHTDPCPHCGRDRTEELRVQPVDGQSD